MNLPPISNKFKLFNSSIEGEEIRPTIINRSHYNKSAASTRVATSKSTKQPAQPNSNNQKPANKFIQKSSYIQEVIRSDSRNKVFHVQADENELAGMPYQYAYNYYLERRNQQIQKIGSLFKDDFKLEDNQTDNYESGKEADDSNNSDGIQVLLKKEALYISSKTEDIKNTVFNDNNNNDNNSNGVNANDNNVNENVNDIDSGKTQNPAADFEDEVADDDMDNDDYW